jgi:hypothetical protein
MASSRTDIAKPCRPDCREGIDKESAAEQVRGPPKWIATQQSGRLLMGSPAPSSGMGRTPATRGNKASAIGE